MVQDYPDVTMADSLNQSNLMQHLMDNIKDNIYFMDHNGRIILINQEGAKWLGYESPQALIGKTDLDIFTNEHGREAYEDEQRIMETGVPILGKEEKETRVDGSVTWVSTSKMPLRNDDGNIVGTFGISRDITEHKNAELRAEKFAEENRRFREDMEQELQMAAELQKTFFPTAYPDFSTGANAKSGDIQFGHLYHASSVVGGDFCSIRKISETEAGIFLCDVMGHGVRAALGTAIIRAVVEEISHQEKDPGAFLSRMNRALMPILRQGGQFLFATACYMVIDVQSGILRCANAGHPKPIRVNAEQVVELGDALPISGPALAVDVKAQYSTQHYELHPGDTIFMYTDGIVEAVNSSDEEFGSERLLQAVNRNRQCTIQDLYTHLIEATSEFSASDSLQDDVCFVGFSLGAAGNA